MRTTTNIGRNEGRAIAKMVYGRLTIAEEVRTIAIIGRHGEGRKLKQLLQAASGHGKMILARRNAY